MLIVKDIVVEYLEKNGFDGLMHDNDCCCSTNNICDDMTSDCQPAYKIPCDCEDDCDFHMTRTKNETN